MYYYEKQKKKTKTTENLKKIQNIDQKISQRQIKSVINLYDSRRKVIDLFNDYAKIRSESIYEAKQDETKQNETRQYGTGLKILISKQLFQKLSIPLAQVKASNKQFINSNQKNCLFSLSIKRNN